MDNFSKSLNLTLPATDEGNARRASGLEAPRLLFKSLRPRQWSKNALVFMALLFSANQYWNAADLQEVWQRFALAGTAFLVLCALSSGEYILNDLLDIQKDREHPTKRNRPLASGALAPKYAVIASVLLIGVGVGTSFVVNLYFGMVAAGYAALVISYSVYIKHIVILDTFAIAAGFVLRAMAGAVVISVPISPWLYLCTGLGALFLGISKRRHELLLLEGNASRHRTVLAEYTTEFLDSMSNVVASSLVVAYSLYTFTSPGLPSNHVMMLTIPFVLYGVLRYQYLVHIRNQGGSPEDVLLTDKPLIIDILLWLSASGAILAIFRSF
ncbi:MAG: decaprenyl-phosphate phosphoribosyltransferase [Dehalococcoidia bacterium]|nr:decaprenyl-phosphate phosphoribosyltransferase [Dehalococcoidia bacterium]